MKEWKMPLNMTHIVRWKPGRQWKYLTDKTGFLFSGTHGICSTLLYFKIDLRFGTISQSFYASPITALLFINNFILHDQVSKSCFFSINCTATQLIKWLISWHQIKDNPVISPLWLIQKVLKTMCSFGK